MSGCNAAVVVEHILLRMSLKFYDCSASGGSAARVTVGRQKCRLDGQISYPPALENLQLPVGSALKALTQPEGPP